MNDNIFYLPNFIHIKKLTIEAAWTWSLIWYLTYESKVIYSISSASIVVI